MAEGAPDDETLELTPTWILAIVCALMVVISMAAERGLHYLGKKLKRNNQKPLYEAVLKVKEELMLLGFISLLLTVCQGMIEEICIPPDWRMHMLPCKRQEVAPAKEHLVATQIIGRIGRRLLSKDATGAETCRQKGKIQLMSLESVHQLHEFIFVLAITHVVFSALTILLGGAKMHQWKQWEEDAIQKDTAGNGPKKVTLVQNSEFVKENFKGNDKYSRVLSWLAHCPGNLKFDFNEYMLRVLESDFKVVVGISWYLWVFVVIFLLLNINGWNTYFWIAFLPLILLLAAGTKLEHVIAQLARDVAEKHSALEGDLIVKPSDDHFWFGRPRIVLFLIHFILFQNAFEIAFFFWILTTYGFNSCIMGHVGFIVPRLVIGVIIQLLCSYCTLPLYAVVTQMGSFYKKEIFNKHVQQGVLSWAQKAKMKKALEKSNGTAESTSTVDSAGPSTKIEMMKPATREGNDDSAGPSTKIEMMKPATREGNDDSAGPSTKIEMMKPATREGNDDSAGPSTKIEMMKPATREGNDDGEIIEWSRVV
ncbi:MLO-like protein 1 isoform X3 [Triticum dicoccoides]|uniref:MLO-like protein 1 isoform X3 n=1 Tax=Triticum dicoccoides TaxID=85692 RepID=UPI000E7BFD5C|nr:MLO-like protein 1 isoform X3 [Triticum dicoccoides]